MCLGDAQEMLRRCAGWNALLAGWRNTTQRALQPHTGGSLLRSTPPPGAAWRGGTSVVTWQGIHVYHWTQRHSPVPIWLKTWIVLGTQGSTRKQDLQPKFQSPETESFSLSKGAP